MEEKLVEYQWVGFGFVGWFEVFGAGLDEEMLLVVSLGDAISVALIPRKLLSLYKKEDWRK